VLAQLLLQQNDHLLLLSNLLVLLMHSVFFTKQTLS
jgi:hypothetical protein